MDTIERRRFPRLGCILGALCCTVLVACGGGEVDPPGEQAAAPIAQVAQASPCKTPEGLPLPTGPSVMGGSIAGRHDPSFILVARGDGKRQLLFYGPDLASTSSVTGYVVAGYGSGVWCSYPDLVGYNGRDYVRRSEESVYLDMTVRPGAPSLSGTIRYASATYSLTGGPVPGSPYDVASPAKVADAVGVWTMTLLSGAPMALAVDANGAVTFTNQGCSMAGTATPSQDGLNLLHLKLTGSQCPAGLSAYEGFALVLPLSGGGTQLLIWVEASGGWDDYDYALAIGRR